MGWKLVSIRTSPNSAKKYRATFKDGEKEKHTEFGAAGMDDYTITHDKEQRERYRKRHAKDLDTGDPTRAGFLSYYLLWNKKTLAAAVADYKRRFE
jgi:hypothetical protein